MSRLRPLRQLDVLAMLRHADMSHSPGPTAQGQASIDGLMGPQVEIERRVLADLSLAKREALLSLCPKRAATLPNATA